MSDLQPLLAIGGTLVLDQRRGENPEKKRMVKNQVDEVSK